MAGGAREHAQAAVVESAVIDGNPNSARRQRANWPIMSVLMPRHFHPVAGWLAECLTAPEHDIGTNDLLDQIDDLVIPSDVQKRRVAGNSFSL